MSGLSGLSRCFTFNNYTDQQMTSVKEKINLYCAKAVFQEEIGENGTPHLQGYINLTKAGRPLQLFAIPQIHWEKAKGNEKQNVAYCTKTETRKAGTVPFKKGLRCVSQLRHTPTEALYPWQRTIRTSLLSQAGKSQRKCPWYWDDGNTGKSTLVRNLLCTEKCIIVGGKAKDIYFAIATWVEKNGPELPLILFELKRSEENFVSYTGMEAVLDGYFFSAKYESGMCVFNPNGIGVFANFPPKRDRLSKDRWDVRNLELIDRYRRWGLAPPTPP